MTQLVKAPASDTIRSYFTSRPGHTYITDFNYEIICQWYKTSKSL